MRMSCRSTLPKPTVSHPSLKTPHPQQISRVPNEFRRGKGLNTAAAARSGRTAAVLEKMTYLMFTDARNVAQIRVSGANKEYVQKSADSPISEISGLTDFKISGLTGLRRTYD